jgi:hypothetical protein
LCDFNPNWKNYEAQITNLEYQDFRSDREYIQSHLKSVLKVLKSHLTDHLSQKQEASRMHLIKVLDQYRISGKFPINYHRRRRIPVFIDENNTHCAVGYLLRETGNASIAQRIAKKDNYVWVKDIKDAEMLTWQAHSGFSLEELKLIQGAYDFYMEDALTVTNRLEIPQKPAVMNLFFDNADYSIFNVWCKGEGKNGVLNGKWMQNYAYAQPWIVGYYANGERTGKWEEYYQGTKQLCRTEHWKNDALNGLRTRFDRQGKVIEKIYFKDGKALTKINYDMGYNPKTYVRRPIDSTIVETQIFDSSGKCIAKGIELIHNPGNLQWFQNIELTALNTFSISAATMQTNNDFSNASNNGNGNVKEFHSPKSFQTPSLVEYKKIGNWTYYRENTTDFSKFIETFVNEKIEEIQEIQEQFPYFIEVSWLISNKFPFIKDSDIYDSLIVRYEDNKVQEIEMIRNFKSKRYQLIHRDEFSFENSRYRLIRVYGLQQLDFRGAIEAIGKIDTNGNKIGEWVYFSPEGLPTKKYEFAPKRLLMISEARYY